MGWNYDDGQYDPNKSYGELIPVGKHRIRIEDVDEQVSKNTGKDMLKITFVVSGYMGKIFYYLVFNDDYPDMTNQKIGEIYDSFGLPKKANLMPKTWIGKVGAAQIKHEMYNDNPQAKLAYFVKRSMQDDLPDWQEPGSLNGKPKPPSGGKHEDNASGSFGSMRDEDDMDIPF